MPALALAQALVFTAGVARAQDAAQVQQGMDFAHGIAPQSPSWLVNPAGVNAAAWSSTAVPTSVPGKLGGFSAPLTSSSAYASAKGSSLTSLGMSAQASCAGFVPTPDADPLRVQECAAVNFLSSRCLTPTTQQGKVIASVGINQGTSANCEGTYGQGAAQFNFQEQVKSTDSMFSSITGLKDNAASAVDANCTPQEAVTEPAQYEDATCVKDNDTSVQSCSQYLNTTITTTSVAAQPSQTCDNGTLVGDYCQATSSSAASLNYACPVGYTLSGENCTATVTSAATPQYACPAGQTLSGGNCTSHGDVASPATIVGYSCPAGQTQSGTNCTSVVTQPRIVVSYSCPAGQTLFGNSCITTSTNTTAATPSYICPAGYTQSGTTCTISTTSAAWPSYSCPAGTSQSGTTCSGVTVSSASASVDCYGAPGEKLTDGSVCSAVDTGGNVIRYLASLGVPYSGTQLGGGSAIVIWTGRTTYSCPSGAALSGTSCVTSYTTSATITGYSCPSGGALSGSSCVTTAISTANVTYSCPNGDTLSGQSCVQTTTVTSPATPSYGCPDGYTLSGQSCSTQVFRAATPNYSCSAGQTLFGSYCITPSGAVTPATVNGYSCPAGQTLDGTNCTSTSTIAASVNYSCPNGGTLSGTSCVQVTTTPATVHYACADGSSPVGNQCIFHSVAASWTDTCGAYTSSAGTPLALP